VHNADKYAPELPSLDASGKLHGAVPRPEDFDKYTREELEQLLADAKQSVPERIRKTTLLGRDRAHGQRQAAEQQLITQLERYLGG
jgi:hypothetical protein